jgi:hypothetical protein
MSAPSPSARATALVVLLCAVALFAMAMLTSVYEVRLYLGYVGIMFMIVGMLIEGLSLLVESSSSATSRERK